MRKLNFTSLKLTGARLKPSTRPAKTLSAAALLLTSLFGCQQAASPSVENTSGVANDRAVAVDNAAHWIAADTLLLSVNSAATAFKLRVIESGAEQSAEPQAELQVEQSIELEAVAKAGWVEDNYRHLAEFSAFRLNGSQLDAEQLAVKEMLKSQLQVTQLDSSGAIVAVSNVQIAAILDQLYTSGVQDADEVTDYGATKSADGVQFKLWAPTARAVRVLLFDTAKRPLSRRSIEMTQDLATGAWVGTGDGLPDDLYYQYQIRLYHPASNKIETLRVTDPYSLSLSRNSLYSQVVDLNEPQTQPDNWHNQAIPALAAPEDHVLYEVHIRDFSASENAISNPDFRGKYKAFGATDSHGINHLRALKKAGLNTIHLLPSFDIGTVNEDPQQRIELGDTLAKLCSVIEGHSLCDNQYEAATTLQELLEQMDPEGSERQALIESIRHHDGYNWGYDPYHYTVPEGSYALNPDGVARIIEFREMIRNIHRLGLRVVMDVVYNHTHQAGLESNAVLDKVVPGYYHRLDPYTGEIAQSTCCDNTATEHVMMAKLMTDSLLVWARDYKIDGFRFDLMAHQPKEAMLKARQAVQAIDPDSYFYGEGWNFGEVANNRRFVQASQLEMAGSQIGTYTDRMRDSVRGGGSFDSGDAIRRAQGIGNGLYTLDNELQNSQASKAKYLLAMDQLRVGLAANLADYPLENAAGELVTGKDIPYGDQPTGYALDPADTINYVSKHDNQTLWDNNQYRIPYHVSTKDRVRLQLLSLSYPLMAQGIPFLHMGSELLRSKSFLRDSYDYGDWFNAVDFSKQSNNYAVGLPPAVKDQANWPLIAKVLENNQGRDRVNSQHISWMSDAFIELLRIRTSSPLFRLRSADDIIERVKFHNTGLHQQDGLIMMSIDDTGNAPDLDPELEQIMVIFNSSSHTQNVALSGAAQFKLHPVQANGVDEIVKSTIVNSDSVKVPALTTAVLVR